MPADERAQLEGNRLATGWPATDAQAALAGAAMGFLASSAESSRALARTADEGRAGAASPTPWVMIRSLSKTFGPVKVLRDVDFDARSGEIHGLVGQNGSGKSTLIKVLSGVYAADAGSAVEVNGTSLSNPVRPAELRRLGLGFVHQDLGLVGEQTVLENMRLGQFRVRRLSRRINWRAEREAARSTLTRLHSEIDCDRLVNTLLPGEKAVVAVGRALQSIVPGTGCVVFDESTRALPREILPDFYETIRRLSRAGTAVIIVSHRLDEVLTLADRVTVLQDGAVVAGGRATEGLTESALAHLVLGRELELLEERQTPHRRGHAPGRVCCARGLHSAVLHGLDLEIGAGEVVGVTGPMTSGHAEIPYVLAGVATDATGTVIVDECEFTLPVRGPATMIRAGVALVPEERALEGLALALTAEENLTLPRVRKHGRALLRSGWQAREFAEAVEMLGVTPPNRHLPGGAFSGGNQQKLLLAKWLLNRPRVVLLHEPTQAVDIGARIDILRAIRGAADLGVCVLVASIESQDLAVVCDRILVLREGSIVAELDSDLSAEAITSASYPRASPPSSVSHGRAG